MLGLKIAKFCGKHLGLYTKKEMVRVCRDIGRELVDIQKSGTDFSKNILQSVVQKHAPKVNVKICTSRAEVKADLLKHGISEKGATHCVEQFDDAAAVSYQHIGGDGKCKGIFIPLDECLPSAFPHEFEHHLFTQNSFISKLIPKKFFQNRSQSAGLIQSNLLKKIDMTDTFMFSSSVPLEKGKKNLIDFLKRFDRLETDKRITAFFRGLCRNATNPKNKGAFQDIFSARQIIQDEKRAYDITDEIIRYSQGIPSGNKTYAGVFSELLGLTDDILKREQITSLLTKASPKTISQGCPSSTKELSENYRLVRDIMRRKK